MNQVTLIGHLGDDPDVRFTKSGTPFAYISVACNRSWQGKDGKWQKAATWVRCTAWGHLAEEIGNNLAKGNEVIAIGEYRTSTYEKNGEKRYKTEVVLAHIGKALPSYESKAGSTKPAPPGQSFNDMGSEVPPDEEIPF